MSYHLFFLVMDPDTLNIDGPFNPVQTLVHFGDQRSFITQIVDIGYGGSVVETHNVPESFMLDRLPYRDRDAEPTCLDPQGNPLRYFYASEMEKVEFEGEVHNFDVAMMAYLRALDPKTPIIPVWYF